MSDIYPIFDRMLDRAAKEQLLGQRGLVVWLYGLSGSGKSTLACSLERKLHSDGVATKLLDGDNIRTGLNRGLGFSDDDRRENIRRIAEVSRLFADAGLVAINSFITPTESLRALAREIIGPEDFVDVFVDCSFETCQQRDVKGLYAKAAAGDVPHFTGRDSSFERPEAPNLVLDTDAEPPEDSLRLIYDFVLPRIRPESARADADE